MDRWIIFLSDSVTAFVSWIVTVVAILGYFGIIVLMAMESTFIPIPSEIIIPPAGYLTVYGDMNILIVIFCGIIGSIIGSTINYIIGLKLGRGFLAKYGKYFLLSEHRMQAINKFFMEHGEITTLIGRLIPVVRHVISFPAGVAKMNFGKFLLYTGLGAGIWVTILAYVGRTVGNNIELVKAHTHAILISSIPIVAIIIVVYILIRRNANKSIDE